MPRLEKIEKLLFEDARERYRTTIDDFHAALGNYDFKAEEMAQTFRQRIAQAEAIARADLLRFQHASGLTLNSDGVLGPVYVDLPAEGLDLSHIPKAEA